MTTDGRTQTTDRGRESCLRERARRCGLLVRKRGQLYMLLDLERGDCARDERRNNKPYFTLDQAKAWLDARKPARPARRRGKRPGTLHPATVAKVARARQLRAQGLTYKQIGEAMGLTRSRVHQMIGGHTTAAAMKDTDMERPKI